MAFGRLIGVTATLPLLGLSGAAAETIYINGQAYVAAPPGSVIITPAPVGQTRYVVSEPAVAIAPQSYVVVSPPASYVAPQTTYVAPRAATTYVAPQTTYVAPIYVAPRYAVPAADPYDAYASAVVDSASIAPSCRIDSFGFERCY